jgi:RNA polymerase sigma factor for flagellar operon FliA
MSEGFVTDNYNKVKRLSTEELEKLWYAFLANKANKKLRDELIVQYLYLTKYVIGRIKGNLPPSFSADDITSYGVEGLIDAIEKYSPEKGARFETYAIMRIRGCIIDKIRAQDWLPRSTRKKIKDVKETAEKLRQELGRPATSSEIGEVLGITKEKVDEILAETTSVGSLYDKKGSSDESIEIIDTIEDTSSVSPLDKLEERDTKKELQQALMSLPPRERDIMVLYYQKNMTLKEIGEKIEVSESRVCQLHAQAIMKLKNILSGQKAARMKKSII